MEIYLIRHTTPEIELGICYGQTDVGLADSFWKEAEAVKQKLPLADGLVVYSSPLMRCLKLAKKLSENPTVDARLMEMNFGEWEMKRWDEMEKEKLDEWMENFVEVACPGGESFTQLLERSMAFYDELIRKEHKTVAVVTHAGVVRSILASIMGFPLKQAFDFKVEYGRVAMVETGEDKKRTG